MSTKVIYFTVNGELEKAEFSSNDTSSQVKDLFTSAAEASSHDVLKLYNAEGRLINISKDLESNTPHTSYKLTTVALSKDELFDVVGADLGSIEQRLSGLELRLLTGDESRGDNNLSDNMRKLRQQVDTLRSKIENIEHLSWIGLSKDLNGTGAADGATCLTNNNWKTQVPHRHKHEHSCENVFRRFDHMSNMAVSDDVKRHLQSVDFNNWQWDDTEMLVLITEMYLDLRFLDTFNIPRTTFHSWLCEVYRHYNQVPFHNFKHCFMVTQMMYGLIKQLHLHKHLSDIELFSLLTSAVCHDLDHPGYNNSYQINAQTELALRYNDCSPLENHHCCIAFKILSNDKYNILKHVAQDTYLLIRQSMIRCILATDMAKHNDILTAFTDILPTFDFTKKHHRDQLMMVLIKCADISNECRPMEVAEPWIDCLLQEFFNQSDLEKKEGLPVSPFMDRDKVNKNSSQVNFIKFVLLPLFDSLAHLFPVIQDPIISPLQDALQYYQKLASKPVPTTSTNKSPVPPVPSSSTPKSYNTQSLPQAKLVTTNGTT